MKTPDFTRFTLFTGIFAALLSLAAAPARAGDDVDERRDVSATGSVRIFNMRGGMEIVGWDRDEAYVTGELDDLSDGLRFEVDGDRTLIRVLMPEHHVHHGDGSALIIYLPRESSVQIGSVSADVNLMGIKGAISIRTMSGNVLAEDIGAATRIHTASGDVSLYEGSGRVKVVTISGEVALELAASDIAVDTMSGEIDLELEAFDTLVVSTTKGELEIEGTLNPAGRIEASTVKGDIELRLEDPINARIMVRTGRGGDIENDINDDEPVEIEWHIKRLETVAGDGSGEIHLTSVKGDIRLEEG
ncbi:MAG: DUF4097 family beta strand repeat-containing protein [Pseudomonadales bacterium]